MDWQSEEIVETFCQSFLDRHRLRKHTQARGLPPSAQVLMELPFLLVEMGLSAVPMTPFKPEDGSREGSTRDESVIIPRSLCVFLADENHTHWVPEICQAAVSLSRPRYFGQEEHFPVMVTSGRPEGSDIIPLELVPHLPRLHTLHPRYEDPQITFTYHVRRGEDRVKVELRSGYENLRAWWENSTEEDGWREFHVSKSDSREKPYPGVLRSVSSEDPPGARWEHFLSMPKAWKIENFGPDSQTMPVDVERYERRDELKEMVDCFLGLNKLDKAERTPDDGSSKYSLTVGGVDLTLSSRKDRFVLSRTGPNKSRDIEEVEDVRTEEQGAGNNQEDNSMENGTHVQDDTQDDGESQQEDSGDTGSDSEGDEVGEADHAGEQDQDDTRLEDEHTTMLSKSPGDGTKEKTRVRPTDVPRLEG